MPPKKSEKRRQTSDKLLRMLPAERDYLDAASAQVAAKLSASHPSTKFGLSNFLMGAALKEAAVVLGATFEQWMAKAKRKDGR
jgi:ADP-ribosylglycohydrolase